jgi:5-carboxymethyl-2-hydroxymuconate isomerase
MPHIIVEYSANLEPAVDIERLVRDVHAVALRSGVFEVGAVRTRAERRDVFVIADGDPANGFIHVSIHMAAGRDAATRKRVAQTMLDTLASATEDIRAKRGLGLSVEGREIDGSASVRLNNLHERMAAKSLSKRTTS